MCHWDILAPPHIWTVWVRKVSRWLLSPQNENIHRASLPVHILALPVIPTPMRAVVASADSAYLQANFDLLWRLDDWCVCEILRVSGLFYEMSSKKCVPTKIDLYYGIKFPGLLYTSFWEFVVSAMQFFKQICWQIIVNVFLHYCLLSRISAFYHVRKFWSNLRLITAISIPFSVSATLENDIPITLSFSSLHNVINLIYWFKARSKCIYIVIN